MPKRIPFSEKTEVEEKCREFIMAVESNAKWYEDGSKRMVMALGCLAIDPSLESVDFEPEGS